METKLNLIVATATNMGIGFKGNIPWRLKKDLAIFARLTKWTKDADKRNAVIMGRKTWESIPEKNRPLPSRVNIILSNTLSQENISNEDVLICPSLDDAIQKLKTPPYDDHIENIWVIGGAAVYKEAMQHPSCHRIYMTRVLKEYECDVFMPEVDSTAFGRVSDSRVPDETEDENGVQFRVEVYEKHSGV